MKLSDLLPGEEAIVLKVSCGAEIGKRLVDMGLYRGRNVLMKRSAILGGPIQIYIGYDLCLRKSEADYVIINKINETEKNEKNN